MKSNVQTTEQKSNVPMNIPNGDFYSVVWAFGFTQYDMLSEQITRDFCSVVCTFDFT